MSGSMYHAYVSVDDLNPSIGTWDEEFRVHQLFDGKHDSVFDSHTYSSTIRRSG